LGEEFFEVRDSGNAVTLINDPPRILMTHDLEWQPAPPLADVVDLFVRGVCQVRNNYFYGEKFVGGGDSIARDHELVRQALWVLDLAADRLPPVGGSIGRVSESVDEP
jgi:hypothetical protein